MLAGINRCLDRVESFAMIVLMLVATCVAIVQVIARYVFNNSLYWSEETVLYTLIMMSFLTCSMGVRYAVHICVEILPLMVGPRLAWVLRYLASLLGLAFAVVLVYWRPPGDQHAEHEPALPGHAHSGRVRLHGPPDLGRLHGAALPVDPVDHAHGPGVPALVHRHEFGGLSAAFAPPVPHSHTNG